MPKRGNRHSYCRVCYNEYQKAWQQKNSDKLKERYAKDKLNDPGKFRAKDWKRRGIDMTWERYEQLLKDQSGVCAICKNPENVEGRALAVDHDHRTGETRGLLCTRCNHALGHFEANETAFRTYLIESK